MNSKTLIPALLGVAVIGAAVLGLRSTTSSNVVPEPQAMPPNAPNAPNQGALPPGHPPIGQEMGSPGSGGMPPGHPAVPNAAQLPGPPAEEEGALEWTAPPRWQGAPNPSSMRLATFKIPKAGADTEDAEMSISRAGGSAAANADRWIGQFDEAGQKTGKKTERTIGKLKVTMVEVDGTFNSGSMMGGAATPKSGWALLGAIVENPGSQGSSYFFKLTGPSATVKSAKAEVDALLTSLKEKKK